MGLLFFIFVTLSYGVAVSAEVGNSFIVSAMANDPNTRVCSDLWWPFREIAENLTDDIGSPRTTLIGPDEQTIRSSSAVLAGTISFVFNIGHSAGPDEFIATCDSVRIPATALPTSDFLFAHGCDTVCETGPEMFASRAKATIGFCELASPECYSCLQSSPSFTQAIADAIAEGLTIGDAFAYAGSLHPECVDSMACARFVGDPTIKIYTPPAECGDRANTYASHEEDWPSSSVWCEHGIPNTLPSFPKEGETSTWTCSEIENDTIVQCSASKEKRKSVMFYLPVILSAGKNK